MNILIASWTINVKTVSEANCSEHWTKKSKRHKQQQLFVRLAFMGFKGIFKLPCRVALTRLANRSLDEGDNLPMAFKYIRDEIAECMVGEGKAKGQADSHPDIKWEYNQEKRVIPGFRIDIFA